MTTLTPETIRSSIDTVPAHHFTFKPVSSDGVSALTQIALKTFEQTFRHRFAPENYQRYVSEAFTEEQLLSELSTSQTWFWMIEWNHSPVGYMKCRQHPNTPACVPGNKPLNLQRIYLEQAVHGKGAGKAALDFCLTHAEQWQADTLWLTVWQHNTQAIGFYKRNGFTMVGTYEFDLGGDLQTDWIMVRSLS